MLFTAWALLSQADDQGHRTVDFGFNWSMNPILVGISGHFILFAAGYGASVAAGGHRPDDIDDLTFWSPKLRSPAP